MTHIRKYLVLANLLKETDHNAKITEIECKIGSVSGLATTAAVNAFENNITNSNDLVKKTNYDEKFDTLRLSILPHVIIMNLWMKH